MRPSAEPNDHARTRILNAAAHLFAERGFAATSVQLIADQVGIRKQSVLHHFPTKEDIRRAVLVDVLARWSEVVPRIFAAAAGGKGRIEGVIREVVEFFAAEPDRARLITRELLDRPEELRQIMAEHSPAWATVVTASIREGQQEGTVFPNVQPEAFVVQMALLISLGVGQLRVMDVLIDPQDPQHALHLYTEELIRLAQRALFIPRAARAG